MSLYSGDKSHDGTSKQELNVQLLLGYFLWNRGFQTVMPSDSLYPDTGSFSISSHEAMMHKEQCFEKTQKRDLKVTWFIPQRLLQLSFVIIAWKKHVNQTKNLALFPFLSSSLNATRRLFLCPCICLILLPKTECRLYYIWVSAPNSSLYRQTGTRV